MKKNIEVHIKDKNNNFYLIPVFMDNNWNNYRSNSSAFYVDESRIDTLKPIDLVDYNLIKNNNVYLVYVINNEEFIIEEKKIKFLKSFSVIKNDFNNYPNKQVEHYIIYHMIKGKDPLCGINMGKKNKFNNTFNILLSMVKMINNYSITKKYLKAPFPNIKNKDFIKIIENIKKNIES